MHVMSRTSSRVMAREGPHPLERGRAEFISKLGQTLDLAPGDAAFSPCSASRTARQQVTPAPPRHRP